MGWGRGSKKTSTGDLTVPMSSKLGITDAAIVEIGVSVAASCEV